jgi:DNA-binding NarL/FixJ family response regulator
MTATAGALERGRAVYRRRDRELAREALDAAHRADPLGAEDLAALGAEELGDIAATFGTTGLTAAALAARGMVRLAGRDADGAVPVLRAALDAYRTLRAPFERARARVLLAQAYEELGVREAAGLERDAATIELRSLGIQGRRGGEGHRRELPAGLTPREAEVLSLVARGRSNQEIADHLVLSVRTIERHLATVYRKLDLHGPSARAAAVSYAHRSGLLGPE